MNEAEAMTAAMLPTQTDVLLGRGVATNRHPGNENFRQICRQHVEVYMTSTKKQKMLISRSVVKHVCTQLLPPGRFLEKNADTGLYHEVDTKRALEKTAQALRDGAAPLRKKLAKDLESLSSSDDGRPTKKQRIISPANISPSISPMPSSPQPMTMVPSMAQSPDASSQDQRLAEMLTCTSSQQISALQHQHQNMLPETFVVSNNPSTAANSTLTTTIQGDYSGFNFDDCDNNASSNSPSRCSLTQSLPIITHCDRANYGDDELASDIFAAAGIIDVNEIFSTASFVKDKEVIDEEAFARELGSDADFFGWCNSDPIYDFDEAFFSNVGRDY